MKGLFLGFLSAFCVTLHAELFFTPEMIASHLASYSDAETALLQKDLEVVRGVCLDGTQNTETLFFLATAGAPGSRKTTILERFLAAHPEYQGGAYLDPDPRTLKFMANTYYAQSLTALMIASTNDYGEVIKSAYEKWRAGSNYIVLNLLEEAFSLGRSIVYGTTATGAHVADFFAQVKNKGYQLVLLLCSCPDEVRYQAIDYRNNVVRFYQNSPEDAINKRLLFPQRMEAYFTYADQLYFYWSDALFEPERLAGIWSNGTLEVLDSEAMQRFIDKYESDRATLDAQGQPIPAFTEMFGVRQQPRKRYPSDGTLPLCNWEQT